MNIFTTQTVVVATHVYHKYILFIQVLNEPKNVGEFITT
jgi:hypothetical protein